MSNKIKEFNTESIDSSLDVEMSTSAELEKKYGIIDVAQAYGIAQSEFEEGLTRLQPEEWIAYGVDIVSRYPELIPYTQMFLNGIENLLASRQRAEEFWASIRDEFPEGSSTVKDGVETANPEMSKRLFQRITGFTAHDPDLPKGEIRAEKGNFVWLFLDKDDLRKVLGENAAGRAKEISHNGQPGWQSYGDNFDRYIDSAPPIMTIIAAKEAWFSTILHESQHGKSVVLKHAYVQFALFPENYGAELDDTLFKIAKSRFVGESHFATGFKEELEAYFTTIGVIDRAGMREGTQPFEESHVLEFLTNIIDNFMDPTSGYGHYTRASSDEEKTELKADAISAAQALIEMRSFQIEHLGLPASTADAVSIKMLRLFPLKSWPTVVRLRKAKHGL